MTRSFPSAFGLWLDRNWRKFGWNEQDFSTNYFSPEAFQASVSQALALADELYLDLQRNTALVVEDGESRSNCRRLMRPQCAEPGAGR
jgi:hypothetical protein